MTLAACGQRSLPPAGQLLMYIDTDAPVPAPADTPVSQITTVALFDTVRVELYDDAGPITDGNRDFAIDSEKFASHAVSFGILPVDGGARPLRARIRLFRGDRIVNAEPPTSMTLDTTVTLPTVPSDGIVPITVVLRVEDLGSPKGTLSDPADPVAGAPTESLVGTWAGGVIRPCESAVASGQACVAGGAFWFGDPAFRGRTDGNDISEERLVTLSPYKVLLHEVTVADFRKVWPQISSSVAAPEVALGHVGGSDSMDWCTWVETPDAEDATAILPLNCVPWATARAYCQAIGMDLPSEAQFEFVASGSGRELGYPWGDDPPGCEDAVWGRSGVGALSAYASDCTPPGTLGWMAPPGTGLLDLVSGAERRSGESTTVVDLGANMSEWSLDRWSRSNEAYWSAIRVFTNPIADLLSPGDGDARPVRGGSWLDEAASARAAFRLFNPPAVGFRGVGFRCAAPD